MALELNYTTLLADANLIAYYRLEDTADSKGSFTLTNNGTVTFAAAKFNNGAELGTSNSTKYLSVNNDLGITNGAISVSMWVKVNTEPGTNTTQSFFEHGDAGNDIRHQIWYQDLAGVKKLIFNRQRENIANDQFTYNVTLGTSTIHHLVLTYDGTTVHGYLNGTDVGNVGSTGNGASGVDIDYTYIGARRTQTPSVTLHASALIDDVAVFNRVLTAAEVLDLYQGGMAIVSTNMLKEYRRTRFPGSITGI